MKRIYYILFILMFIPFSCSQKPLLKVGLVADPQYADKPMAGSRHYKESIWKLEQAIDTFNYEKVDFVQSLGDIIDDGWSNFDSILPIYNKLSPDIESYHLLGNHDFSIDSIHMRGLLDRLSMSNYYYSYSKKGWRFIVLDATDYAYFSNPLHNRDVKKIDSYYETTKGESNKQIWNSAIGEEQQRWLKEELAIANKMNQKVIVFSHLPIMPESNAHNLWNDFEIVNIIEQSSNVAAFINGHNHAGEYEFNNGIHYITLVGMVETMVSSYGILEVYKDRLVLTGYGNQESMVSLAF